MKITNNNVTIPFVFTIGKRNRWKGLKYPIPDNKVSTKNLIKFLGEDTLRYIINTWIKVHSQYAYDDCTMGDEQRPFDFSLYSACLLRQVNMKGVLTMKELNDVLIEAIDKEDIKICKIIKQEISERKNRRNK